MIIVPHPELFACAMIFALALTSCLEYIPAYTAAILDPMEAIESE